jgi:hypothetical protein
VITYALRTMDAATSPPATKSAKEASASGGATPPVAGREGAEYCEAAALAVALTANYLPVIYLRGAAFGLLVAPRTSPK